VYTEPVVLQGRHVRLQPMLLEHASGLFEAMRGDDEVWRYLPVRTPESLDDLEVWMQEALRLQELAERLPFTVVYGATGVIAGNTSYMSIEEANRNLEIGWTWYGREYRRTAVNTECKYLLLTHAFETLGCVRVSFRTDLRNERSQRAIERIGGVREGVLRRNRLLSNGYQRSTVCYSILDDEWPAVRARLEGMLSSGAEPVLAHRSEHVSGEG
jgi:RimJ/RimL family protein N-acetyltransferase